jgi:hypothetical protein
LRGGEGETVSTGEDGCFIAFLACGQTSDRVRCDVGCCLLHSPSPWPSRYALRSTLSPPPQPFQSEFVAEPKTAFGPGLGAFGSQVYLEARYRVAIERCAVIFFMAGSATTSFCVCRKQHTISYLILRCRRFLMFLVLVIFLCAVGYVSYCDVSYLRYPKPNNE